VTNIWVAIGEERGRLLVDSRDGATPGVADRGTQLPCLVWGRKQGERGGD
jgi:hypothetical protein